MLESVEVRRIVGRGLVISSPRSADSGTRRIVDGSILFDGLIVGCWADDSRLGRPLAAAAHDRSVDKLALNAASWSAWCDGEITLYGVWDLLRC